MSNADAAGLASICTVLGVVVQSVANQWGAERARKHELNLKRLEIKEEDEEKKE